ncbi:MAG: hypothetical protein ACRD1L_13030, partial [Terriglobales bacterium]
MRGWWLAAVVGLALGGLGEPARGQQKKNAAAITKAQLMMAGSMLGNVRDALKQNYYDAALHGVNLDARYEKYRGEIEKAPTSGAAFRTVAAFLSGMNDSHTFFLPPPRSYDVFYGYRKQLIGGR